MGGVIVSNSLGEGLRDALEARLRRD